MAQVEVPQNQEIYIRAISQELKNARNRFPPFNSSHEGYAILLEEVDEMWDEIKKNDIRRSKEEAIQVAAMALSYLIDVKDK